MGEGYIIRQSVLNGHIAEIALCTARVRLPGEPAVSHRITGTHFLGLPDDGSGSSRDGIPTYLIGSAQLPKAEV
jgi:hypothetical protein